MHWRAGDLSHANQLAELTSATGRTVLSTADASGFLEHWSVDLCFDDHEVAVAVAAAAVLPPPNMPNRRAYGFWWDRRPDAVQHIPTLIRRTVEVAGRTHATTLQFSLPPDDRDRIAGLVACGFRAAFPLWDMRHDQETWPSKAPELPPPLRLQPWTEELTESFLAAYLASYQDQRVVDPHTAKTWRSILSGDAFSATISTMAVAPDDLVVGFILAFQQGDHVELGPIGTIRSWRGRGVSTALLEHALHTCHGSQIDTIGLTVDADSPTGAHRLYLKHGFTVTEELMAYHLELGPTKGIAWEI